MNHEFDAIRTLFQQRVPFKQSFTSIANGDDASVHCIPQGMELVISTDAAVAGIHWPLDTPLHIAGARAVHASLSDLAAMGAKPAWIWLSVLAENNDALIAMSHGIVESCLTHHIELAGGDTVRSPNNAINVTVGGLVPKGSAMTRTSAQQGDEVWLLGDLGLSTAGLKQWQSGDINGKFVPHFQTIQPLYPQGITLREMGIQSCLDISDGLLQDANHLCHGSDLGFSIELTNIQSLDSYQQLLPHFGAEESLNMVLAGGEDYALLFTANPSLHNQLEVLGAHKLGHCIKGHHVQLTHDDQVIDYDVKGFDHFA